MERASGVTGKIQFPVVGGGFKGVYLIIIPQVILLLTGLFSTCFIGIINMLNMSTKANISFHFLPP